MASGVVTSAVQSRTVKTVTNLTDKEGYLMNYDGTTDQLIAIASAGTVAPFCLLEGVDGTVDTTNGRPVSVAVGGVVKVKAGGSITAGARLTSDSAGKAVVTTSTGNVYGFIALENGATDDLVAALVQLGVV